MELSTSSKKNTLSESVHDIIKALEEPNECKLYNSDKTIFNAFESITKLISEKSEETMLHTKRVSSYSVLLAELVGMKKEDIKILSVASLLHDIGKILIPLEILHKKDTLTDGENIIMERHPAEGYRMLKESKVKQLQAAAIIAYTHHENFDGTGYPRGLKCTEIDIFGRIVAVADVFDALRSKRSYKCCWSLSKIEKFFTENSGSKFDPKIVDTLLCNMTKLIEIENNHNKMHTASPQNNTNDFFIDTGSVCLEN